MFQSLAVILGLTAMAALAYQPQSNITRGMYCGVAGAISTSAWAPFRTAGEYVSDEKHSGGWSIRCDNTGGGPGSGAGISQRLSLNQREARPLRIAGWSKCRDVPGEAGWQYSLYVDLTYADGESWPMQIAAFSPGTHDWEHTETVIEPAKPVATAAFYAFIREKPGVVWFDDLFFGEVDGPNLLRNAGFEPEDRVDLAAREKLLADYADLNANAMHIYMSAANPLWDSELVGRRYEGQSPFAEFLAAVHERGIGVWVTLGGMPQSFRDADDPAFPIYECPNGQWGDLWVAALADCARNDIAGISLTPDEYNYNTYHLKRGFERHADERVRAFYEALPPYCNCPECERKFRDLYGTDLPDLHSFAQTDDWRNYINSRYISTTEWLRRSAEAVKQANPQVRADSLICVTPVCSDRWWSVGVAWDQVGYGTAIDFLTTDPYILLHNYLGDSTHWYVTETAQRLSGAHPKRQCGIVLEASRLRPEQRELEPVEVYGSALSAVFHGAKELAWWHHRHITGESGTALDHDKTYAIVKATYQLLSEVDPWLEGLTSPRRIALLHSRASEDWWRFYTDGEAPHECLTHPDKDARYASRAQVEVLMHCLRNGIPVDLYYLEAVTAAQLADYPVVVVPFPFAISDEQAQVLGQVAEAGAALVVISEVGTVTEDGEVRERAALLDLLGLREAPAGEQTWRLEFALGEGMGVGSAPDEVTVYALVEPRPEAQVRARLNGVPVILDREVGVGRVVFLAGEFGAGLPESYDNEMRTRTERVYPPRHRETHSALLGGLYGRLLDADPAVARVTRVSYDGPAPGFPDDVEVVTALNAAGDLLCLATNWTAGAAELAWNVDGARFDLTAASGRAILPDASVREVTGLPEVLQPQEAWLIRAPAL